MTSQQSLITIRILNPAERTAIRFQAEDPGREPVGIYSIEVFNAVGDTIVVTVVPESAIEALRDDQVLSVRLLAKTA